MSLASIILAVIPSVLSGITIMVVTRQQNKADKQREERVEREELTLKALDALFCVTKELVDCELYNKTPNGEMKEAFDYKQRVKHELEDYQRKKASK